MCPAHPPPPTPSRFPFHINGSQTSILMSESLVGFNVAAIRQKAGRDLRSGGAPKKLPPPPAPPGRPPGPPPPGGAWRGVAGIWNAPAGTVCAMVIILSGRVSFARLSQETAGATPWPTAVVLSSSAQTAEAARCFPAWITRRPAVGKKQRDFML